MYALVGEFCVSGNISTVPLTRYLCNTIFSRNQNVHKSGNRCTYIHECTATNFIMCSLKNGIWYCMGFIHIILIMKVSVINLKLIVAKFKIHMKFHNQFCYTITLCCHQRHRKGLGFSWWGGYIIILIDRCHTYSLTMVSFWLQTCLYLFLQVKSCPLLLL